MIRSLPALAAALPILTGCGWIPPNASAPVPLPEEQVPAPGGCDAAPAHSRVGQRITETTGAAILAETGARTLRWGPPDSAWTMDYSEDRVNVRYDANMVISEVTCG